MDELEQLYTLFRNSDATGRKAMLDQYKPPFRNLSRVRLGGRMKRSARVNAVRQHEIFERLTELNR